MQLIKEHDVKLEFLPSRNWIKNKKNDMIYDILLHGIRKMFYKKNVLSG